MYWTVTPNALYQYHERLVIGSSLTFAYDALYGPGNGPFAAYSFDGTFFGDPAIPLSPDAIAAGILPYIQVSSVPVPGAVWLFSSALGGFGVVKRRRQLT